MLRSQRGARVEFKDQSSAWKGRGNAARFVRIELCSCEVRAMRLSQLARSIKESVTLKLNETAALLREKGEPVIHLGGGEPKSNCPLD